MSPFSFFNLFSTNPAILVFSPSRRVRDNTTKHTLENVKEVPEVVIHVVHYGMVEQMSLASYFLHDTKIDSACEPCAPSDSTSLPMSRDLKLDTDRWRFWGKDVPLSRDCVCLARLKGGPTRADGPRPRGGYSNQLFPPSI